MKKLSMQLLADTVVSRRKAMKKGGNHEEIIDAAACRYRGIPP